jgi:uncharacterized protein
VQRAQAARLNKRGVIRFVTLLAAFGSMAALLFWAKTAADTSWLSLPNALQDFVTLTLSIVVEALPFVVLGALVSAVIRL